MRIHPGISTLRTTKRTRFLFQMQPSQQKRIPQTYVSHGMMLPCEKLAVGCSPLSSAVSDTARILPKIAVRKVGSKALPKQVNLDASLPDRPHHLNGAPSAGRTDSADLGCVWPTMCILAYVCITSGLQCLSATLPMGRASAANVRLKLPFSHPCLRLIE